MKFFQGGRCNATLGGVCSIQLSYGDIFDFSWSRMERSASQDFDDLIIRRRPLYPTELRGLIQKIFNFAGLQDSNDSIFRRRPLYPTELRGLIQKIFNFTGLQDSNDSIFRRGLLYPFNYGGICNCGAAHGRLVYSTQFHRYCQCGTRTFLESGGFFSPSAVAIQHISGYNK